MWYATIGPVFVNRQFESDAEGAYVYGCTYVQYAPGEDRSRDVRLDLIVVSATELVERGRYTLSGSLSLYKGRDGTTKFRLDIRPAERSGGESGEGRPSGGRNPQSGQSASRATGKPAGGASGRGGKPSGAARAEVHDDSSESDDDFPM